MEVGAVTAYDRVNSEARTEQKYISSAYNSGNKKEENLYLYLNVNVSRIYLYLLSNTF
jgi:hypothetical protein